MKSLSVLFASLALLISGAASASTVSLNSTAQGWINQTGGSNGTGNYNNYIAGNCGLGDCNNGEYRNFFTFSIPTLAGLSSARLDLNSFGSQYLQSGTNTYTVTSTSGLSFATLGTGNVFGTLTGHSGDPSGIYSINLDAAALTAISGAQGGLFTISGRITSPTTFGPTVSDQFLFGGSFGSGNVHLVLDTTPVPEPTSIALLGLGIAGLATVRRRRRAV